MFPCKDCLIKCNCTKYCNKIERVNDKNYNVNANELFLRHGCCPDCGENSFYVIQDEIEETHHLPFIYLITCNECDHSVEICCNVAMMSIDIFREGYIKEWKPSLNMPPLANNQTFQDIIGLIHKSLKDYMETIILTETNIQEYLKYIRNEIKEFPDDIL